MNNQLAIAGGASHGISFFDMDQFTHAQRVANLFATSALSPQAFQGNVANCTIALDIALRTGSSPLAVMQNLNIIHGKPSWSSQYIIASILSCGRFTPLRYEIKDLGPIELKGVKTQNKSCVAYAWEKSVPEADRTRDNRLESPPITCDMAIQEGWWSKNGSKWPVMTELMLRYRAATLFGRMYAPDVLMGMQTQEEVQDIIDIDPLPAADEKKALALENKLAGDLRRPDGEPRPGRKARGASAAGSTAAPEPAPETPPAPPASTEPAPPPPTQPAPAPAPAPEPKVDKVDQAKVRVSIVKAGQICVPAKPAQGDRPAEPEKLITQVELSSEEFTGIAYYEAPLIKFEAGDGQVIDAVLERRPHKTKPNEFVNVLVSFTVLA